MSGDKLRVGRIELMRFWLPMAGAPHLPSVGEYGATGGHIHQANAVANVIKLKMFWFLRENQERALQILFQV